MLRRFMPLALTMTLFCPLAAFAQTPPVAPAPPAAADTAAPAAKKPRVGGKISAVDAAAKTITVMHGKKRSFVVSVPDTAKIYKAGDAKGQPTGTFSDLTVDTRVTVATKDENATPVVAKSIHIRAPKTGADEAAPAIP